jgi:hypothetical protein
MTALRRIGPALFGVFGTVMAFHPIILSGFARMETDPADSRHLNYVLEHDFRWLVSRPGHTELWSPPIFFPEKNTAAYSETLLGVLPFYAPWRIVGMRPDTSFQCWILTLSLLNFAASYFLLSRFLGLRPLGASLGAFLFSFGSPRVVQSGHQQLIAQFFTITAVIALVALFRPAADQEPRSRRVFWIGVFFASLLAQFYAGFYLAWLFALGLCVVGIGAFFVRDTRRRLIWLVSRHGLAIAVCAFIAALAVAPMASRYLEAASILGYRGFDDTEWFLPPVKAWFNVGPYNWLYGSLSRGPLFSKMRFEWEKRLGVGLLTTLVVAYGLLRARGKPGVRILLGSAIALIVLATRFPGGHTLWKAIFEVFPGARAIRAVGRVAILLLLPAGVGVAYAFDYASRAVRKAVVLLVAVLVVVEQGQTMPSYDKNVVRRDVAAISRQIPKRCEAFFVVFPEDHKSTWETQVDGMWAGMETGLPTVNGYSSNVPPGWESLFNNQIHWPRDAERIRRAFQSWLRSHGRDPAEACLVRIP